MDNDNRKKRASDIFGIAVIILGLGLIVFCLIEKIKTATKDTSEANPSVTAIPVVTATPDPTVASDTTEISDKPVPTERPMETGSPTKDVGSPMEEPVGNTDAEEEW